MKSVLKFFSFVLIILNLTYAAFAEGPSGEKADLDKLRSNYWSQGDKDEMAVIQNRQYTKSRRLEFGLLGGLAPSDPFLAAGLVGARLGYYFTETFAIEVNAWKMGFANSSAFESLEQNQALTVYKNPPYFFLGGGVDYAPIYGKLSLLGNNIIHFDFSLRAGAGIMSTQSGDYFAPYVGIGQRFYINRWFSVTADYKFMYYSEQVQVRSNLPGPQYATRANWTNLIMLGIGFLF